MRKVLLCLLLASPLAAQTSFDVASMKLNKSVDAQPFANFPLGPGDVYTPNGGYFNATNWPLLTYILFAYKVQGPQARALVDQLPQWVNDDRFDIQARVAGNPTKDQMRTMVKTLLAERCKLAIHEETKAVSVGALVLVKPGTFGPLLQPHPAGTDCPLDASVPIASDDERFPAVCGGLLQMPPSAPGRIRVGARNVTMPFIANALSGPRVGARPIVDKTGLDGRFDFALEFAPDQMSASPDAAAQPELTGPTFEQALKAQMGIKLESQKGAVTVLKVDHIEHPSEN